MPGPARYRRTVQAIVKMVNAPSLSLRGGRRPTWRPEREARGSALGVQSRSTQPDNRVLPANTAALRDGASRTPPPTRRVRSAGIPGNLQLPKALTERRYRRNRLVRFYRHLVRTGSAFPRLPRRFAPRNDNSGAIIILMSACSVRRCSAGRGMPRPYNAQPETFRFYSPRLALFFSPEIWYDGRRRCSAWRMCLTILTGAAI